MVSEVGSVFVVIPLYVRSKSSILVDEDGRL